MPLYAALTKQSGPAGNYYIVGMLDDEQEWLGSVAVAGTRRNQLYVGLVAMMVLEETVVFVWWKQGGPILDSKNYRNGELQSPTEVSGIIL